MIWYFPNSPNSSNISSKSIISALELSYNLLVAMGNYLNINLLNNTEVCDKIVKRMEQMINVKTMAYAAKEMMTN